MTSDQQAVAERPPSYPTSLEQANQWIDNLRLAYRREQAYAEKLSHENHVMRDALSPVHQWVRARGMHKAQWLPRIRDAFKKLREENPYVLI